MESDPPLHDLPTTLLDLLANPIISDTLVSYLPLQTLFRLSRTSRLYRNLIINSPKNFRCLDLSRCKGAYIPHIPAIDNGGHSWRAERMDENLTEDEFYAGPLRYVLGRLERLHILGDVHTLVLDELASVTNDLVHEIVTGDTYNVRLLSIRKCPNVNQSKLQQLLMYICRPTRPEGTPRLQGIYVFTDPAVDRLNNIKTKELATGITTEDGATLGLLPNEKSSMSSAGGESWYAPSGRVILPGALSRSTWEETLQSCKGVIAFDAVLCDSMHQAMSSCLHDASREFLTKHKPGIPTIASIALGPEGCAGCGCAPENTPVWGENSIYDFPLLSPPPFSGKLVDAIRPPERSSPTLNNKYEHQRLIVSCAWCLINRHCDSCHKWWCADCYNPKRTRQLQELEALSNGSFVFPPTSRAEEPQSSGEAVKGDSVKDHDHPRHHHYLPLPPGQPAVTRECWDCGRVCVSCAARSARICKRCRSAYCVWHNDGCDEKTCDWCMYRSGRSTRELY